MEKMKAIICLNDLWVSYSFQQIWNYMEKIVEVCYRKILKYLIIEE